MFETLLTCPHAIARHCNGPLSEARRQYLAYCADRGMKIPTLRVLAHYLLAITKYLRLDKRSDRVVLLVDIRAAAARWSKRRPRSAKRVFSQRRFLRHAKRWLQFMGRLEQPATVPHAYAERVAAFAEFQTEKGLSPQTVSGRCRRVQVILDTLCGANLPMEKLTLASIDGELGKMARDGSLTRTSIGTYAAYLRAFFKYAETRGWCRVGLAMGIIAPRIYAQEAIPSGPSRDDVQRVLATTKGDRPSDIRDRAILLLLIVYGFRSGEVGQLQLDDLDWERELICVRRSKQGRTQLFPLSGVVGDAIVRYLKEVRPRTSRREVFLALNAPIRPLHRGTLYQIVAPRLRSADVPLRHYGPHALRHACATHLLSQGHSMKEIGDYLGHSHPESTYVYAKVNLPGLRTVADFNMEGLL